MAVNDGSLWFNDSELLGTRDRARYGQAFVQASKAKIQTYINKLLF